MTDSKMGALLAHLGGVTGGDGLPVVAQCPAHEDDDPSLSVAIGESGKVLLNCFAGCSFTDIGRALGPAVSLAGNDWAWPDGFDGGTAAAGAGSSAGQLHGLERFIDKCAGRLWAPEGAAALAYVRERFGMSDVLIRGFRLGFSPAEGEIWEAVGASWTAVPRLVVPFISFDGVVSGAQGRALADHKTRWAGLSGSGWARSAMFQPGLFDSVEDGPLIVCEGPSDALTAAAAGVDSVAVRGASLRSAGVLDEFLSVVRDRTVIVCGDSDTAGALFADSVTTSLVAAGVDARPLRVAMGTDLNEWFAESGVFFERDLRDHMAMADAPIVQAQRADIARRARVASNVWDAWPVEGGPPDTSHVGACDAVLWYMHATNRDCCYVHGYAGPSLFDGRVWRLGAPNAVRAVLQEAGLVAKQHSDDDHPWHEDIVKLGGKLGSTNFLNSLTKELTALVPSHDPDEFDAIEHLLQAANGVIDLRTGDLTKPDPRLLITTELAVEFRPEADCDRWHTFLAQVMREEESTDKPMSSYMQRLVGYGITGSTAEQMFAVHYGTGSNGKSVFMETLADVFRSGMCRTVPFSVFEAGLGGGSAGPSSDIARLRGSRLVFTSEGEGKPMKEGLLKLLTGGDRVTARHLFSEEIEFESRFLIQLASNYKPDFRGVDEGLWRRVKLIEWDRHFGKDERDDSLRIKLRQESEGILAWAVRGSMLWYRSGLREPGSVSDATDSYRDTADILAGFYPDGALKPGTADSPYVTLAAIFFAFQGWAEREGIETYSRRWLRANLDTRGVKFSRTNQGMVANGVVLDTTL
jgi:putative DNA primase/helicase